MTAIAIACYVLGMIPSFVALICVDEDGIWPWHRYAFAVATWPLHFVSMAIVVGVIMATERRAELRAR